ncbi:uncharacterized protein LOC124157319 [Ischnura elegans]|uniref:uncharacterized protein LOC124157319 n=1 Tax=Ischnura elegans TaxID=197161 RepID=UPI001ED8764C|nr:uncharacterized protein LOC124157319 [Ischnura elegans]
MKDSKTTPAFVEVKHHIQSKKAQRILRRASTALLRERVQHTRWAIQKCTEELYDLHLALSASLNNTDWETLDRITWNSASITFISTKEKQVKKFEHLHSRQHPELETHGPKNDRSVVNLTDIHLSDAAISVLSKGLNFAVAPARLPKEELVTEVEYAVRKLPKEEADELRGEVSRILLNSKTPVNNVNREEKKALRELRTNDDIIITPADKGNATVVMNKEDYISKINDLLNDDTYSEEKLDPTSRTQKGIKHIINQSSIPPEERKWIIESAPKPPRLYGLPKIHKQGVPLRPIVSAIDSPSHKLAKYLAQQLVPFSGQTSTHVKNSAHFIEIIKKAKISKDDILVSFDVVSLFTNIPIGEAVEIIKTFTSDGLPEDIPKMVEFCLRNSYFTWNGKFYRQTNGAAMGSPLSPDKMT